EEEVHEKPSDETEVLVQKETPADIIEEQEVMPRIKEKALMERTSTLKKVKRNSKCEFSMDENRHVSIAQARRNMITYLKNQGGYKESYFKKMSYNDIRPIFERVWDHVNTFIPIGSEVEKDSSKPSEKETSKAVEEGKVEEEEVNPEQDDDIWKNQNQWKLISWKLYETCGVHTLMVDGTLMTIHMFVEKKYPLTKETLQKMLNWKLEAKVESSMAFELLKFIKTQIEEQ
ncbi:hypothetical protein Tco_1062798, partial [Tanacetum coccineum]